MDSVQPPYQQSTNAAGHFRLSVRILASLLCFAVMAACFEIGLRVWSFVADSQTARLKDEAYHSLYSPQELQTTSLPRQQCVHMRSDSLHWDARFGFAAKVLDKACAKKLFKSDKNKVVLLGGSTMDSALAPNYQTTIDHYAFGGDEKIVSINLAESGARLSNMLARFLYEVIELRPNVAVFLVGLNEFKSIRYGGLPNDDFYWTTGVSRRIHQPMMFFLDKVVEVSKLAQLILIQTGIYRTTRLAGPKVDLNLVDQDVDYYFRTQDYIAVLCKGYSIRCIFILQPTPLVQKHLDDRTRLIVQHHLKYFPQDQEIFMRGYSLLKAGRSEGQLLDPSALFDDFPNAYFDVDHFTKVGNALLGKYIRDAIAQQMGIADRSPTPQ